MEVFGRASNRRLYRRPYDGTNWQGWADLPGLDGTIVDARSDLDCSSGGGSVHIVATGLNPVGAFLHAFGWGTAYNPFVRELSNATFSPGASIVAPADTIFTLAAIAYARPVVSEFGGDAPSPHEVTPIATETNFFTSAPDLAKQSQGASGLTYIVGFDDAGALAIYYYVVNTADASWNQGVKLLPPTGVFAFSPTICTENGGYGTYSVNVAAVADGRLWYAKTLSIQAGFSGWVQIGSDVSSAPDCIVAGGGDSIVHVVVLSSRGSILDIHGKGTTWTTTDLGMPPL